jgi:hypothetical protein
VLLANLCCSYFSQLCCFLPGVYGGGHHPPLSIIIAAMILVSAVGIFFRLEVLVTMTTIIIFQQALVGAVVQGYPDGGVVVLNAKEPVCVLVWHHAAWQIVGIKGVLVVVIRILMISPRSVC